MSGRRNGLRKQAQRHKNRSRSLGETKAKVRSLRVKGGGAEGAGVL